MSDSDELKKKLRRHLLPLYISAFFQSAVLWYAIEKLFMKSIGFSNTGIGIMVALYSAVMLLVETPSGILADRWSRKGVLMLAAVCQSLSALIGGLSHGFGTYMIMAAFWGFFYACYSSMYDSIVYDTIAEAGGESRLFDYLYGRVQFMESTALVLGGLLGGFIASATSLRTVYFLSVPLALVPIIVLAGFREPTLHKKQTMVPMRQQITLTLQAVLRNPSLLPIVIVLVLRSALIYTIFEFSQLWLLALHTPTKYYGIAYAVVFASIGIGGLAASHLKFSRYAFMLATIVIMLVGFMGLVFFHNSAAIVLSEFVAATCLMVMNVIFSRLLHDQLSPNIRAGAASATSTIGRLIIIPLAIIFTYTSQKLTIFKASYIPLVMALLMSVFIIAIARRNGRMGLESRN